jgi:hypothetical protein
VQQGEDICNQALVLAASRLKKSALLSLREDRRLVEKGLDSSPTVAVQPILPDQAIKENSFCQLAWRSS